jgi:FG-GAP repeat
MRPLLLLSLLAIPASAQKPVLWTNGDGPGDRLGSRVAACGDVDDDGFPDWIVGAPKADANGPNSGSAMVFSGKSGALLHRFDGDSAGIEFGSAVDGAGDVNGDGHDDLIVGAPRKSDGMLSSGEVIVFSGADGSVLQAPATSTATPATTSSSRRLTPTRTAPTPAKSRCTRARPDC